MKGIAVRQLVLMVLALLVLVIVAYMVYIYLTGPSPLSTTDCRNLASSYCLSCNLKGWKDCGDLTQKASFTWITRCTTDSSNTGPLNFDPTFSANDCSIESGDISTKCKSLCNSIGIQ